MLFITFTFSAGSSSKENAVTKYSTNSASPVKVFLFVVHVVLFWWSQSDCRRMKCMYFNQTFKTHLLSVGSALCMQVGQVEVDMTLDEANQVTYEKLQVCIWVWV